MSEALFVRVIDKPGFDATALRLVFAIGVEFDWSAVLVRSDAGRLAQVPIEDCEPYESRDVGRCSGCDRYYLGLPDGGDCWYCREERRKERSQS